MQTPKFDPSVRHTHGRVSQCGLCRIELDDVSVSAGGDELLRGVSFHIHCGELTALVGPNGAGKTTLVRALLRQVPFTGSIRHMDAHDADILRLRTGYVPQQLPFDRQMPVTVSDMMAATLSRRPVWTGVGRRTREKIREALSFAQAESLADKQLGQLSGGELQRVLLAMALTPTPDLLILDEPVSGIDQNGIVMFLSTVLRLRTMHMAILLVSHDWTLVRDYADQVVLLDKTVLCSGAPGAVFSCDRFTEAFPPAADTRKV